MAVKEKDSPKELEETDRGIKPRGRIKNPRYINITLTPFQHAQIEALVEIGIASSPTNFARMAITELVRQNKYILTQNSQNSQNIPPAKKRKKKTTATKTRSEQLDNLVKRIINGNKDYSPEEIVKLREKLSNITTIELIYSDKEIEALRESILKQK